MNNCVHKFNNLEEMDPFLKDDNLPKLIQQEGDNLSNSINIKEIESIVKNLPQNKSPGPDILMGESYQTFNELASILHPSRGKKCKGNTSNSFYEASVIMKPKLGKTITKKQAYRLIHSINIEKSK